MIKTIKIAKKHGISVKGSQSMVGMDGLAWRVQVLIDGKVVGTVANDGNGGMPYIDMPKQNIARVVEAYKEYGAPLDIYGSVRDEERVETFIGALVDELETVKKFKRICKTKTAVRLQDDPVGEIVIFKAAYSPEVKNKIVEKYPNVEYFVNELLLEV